MGDMRKRAKKAVAAKRAAAESTSPAAASSGASRATMLSMGVVGVVLAALAYAVVFHRVQVLDHGGLPAVTRAQAPAHERFHVACSSDYREFDAQCAPSDCGSSVKDGVVTEEEAAQLRGIAEKAMKFGGGAGGPTIFDLASGALSVKRQFVNLYKVLEGKAHDFVGEDFLLVHDVVQRIKQHIEREFGVSGIHLARPSFFARISADKPPQIPNDEYYHIHIDKIAYGVFTYTGLVYLNNVGEDFDGGLFTFYNATKPTENGDFTDEDFVPTYVVEPSAGRLLTFTSGAEMPHNVAKVTRGTRYVLTVAFSCDPSASIEEDFLGEAIRLFANE